MTLSLKTTLLIACLCIFFAACKKETVKTPVIKEIKVSDAIKEWGQFKQGSYWIVKDSASAETDSVFVTSVVSTMQKKMTADTTFAIEKITINLNGHPLFSSLILCSYPSDRITTPTGFTSPAPAAVTVFETDSTDLVNGSYGGGITSNRSVSNLQVYGQSFTNLRCASFGYSYQPPSHGTMYYIGNNYWKKNIGFVKSFDFNQTKNIGLWRYHVVQ